MASTSYLPSLTGVSQDYAGIPRQDQPITQKGDFATVAWWRFFLTLVGKQPELAITVGASPTTFTASARCNVLVNGTVTSLQVKRLATYTLPFTQGFVPMSPGDQLTITYPGSAPTATYFPS